jgi:hypothetical protein
MVSPIFARGRVKNLIALARVLIWTSKDCVKKKPNIRQIFDKGNILISRDTNYIDSMQQRNTLMAIQMHIDKKDKETKKIKNPL